ncbi:hypothetical protein [Levilactobacillus brevis]|uniref:hypothetical protein n=1 Tax=Levilactobacillus brevis TaxID=1580 RepID=UPI003D162C5D
MYEVYLLVGFLTFWLAVIVLIASAGYQLRKSVARAGGWAPFLKNFFGMEGSNMKIMALTRVLVTAQNVPQDKMCHAVWQSSRHSTTGADVYGKSNKQIMLLRIGPVSFENVFYWNGGKQSMKLCIKKSPGDSPELTERFYMNQAITHCIIH